jgi:Uma2 family endonuclease
MQAPAPIKTETITFEDYLRRYDSYEGGTTEWSDGEVTIYPMTNNIKHQNVIFILALFLKVYLQRTKVGILIQSNIPMKIDERNAPEPDLMVLLNAHRGQVTSYVKGIADIVVDVVSPESDEHDYGRNRLLYEAAGVPEYWLIDQTRERIILYNLEGGLFKERPLLNNRITSDVLSRFSLDAALLWDDEPDIESVIKIVQAML